MKLSPNFSQISTPLQDGTYLCLVVSGDVRVGKASGHQYVNWKLHTLPAKRVVYYSTPLEGPGAGMFRHFVRSTFDPTYLEGDCDLQDIIGKVVSMDLKVEDVEKADGKTLKTFTVKTVSQPTLEQLRLFKQTIDEEIQF